MNESLENYLLAHIDPEPELLKELVRDANVNLLHPRMISGHLQGRLLKMLVQMINPLHVLEVGTYTGYSAICMAEGLIREQALIHTIEKDDEMERFIRKYLNQSDLNEKIRLYIGDACDLIPKFDDDFFDLAFIDADKRIYWKHYELTLPKVRRGGFIIADNTLWSGKVAQEVESNDWQTKGIIEFNDKLKEDIRVEKVMLPLRDGLTFIRKK
ncbi:MAG: O-methyltransferase [Dysgonamonadaceae bacterium]